MKQCFGTIMNFTNVQPRKRHKRCTMLYNCCPCLHVKCVECFDSPGTPTAVSLAEAIDKVVLHVSIGEYVTCTPRIYCKRATEIALLCTCGLYLQETRLTVTHCTSWQKLSLIVAMPSPFWRGGVCKNPTTNGPQMRPGLCLLRWKQICQLTDKHTCSTVV